MKGEFSDELQFRESESLVMSSCSENRRKEIQSWWMSCRRSKGGVANALGVKVDMRMLVR